MSRYAISIFCLVLAAHLIGYASSIMASQELSSPVIDSNARSGSMNSESNNNGLIGDGEISKRAAQATTSYLLDGQATNLRDPRVRKATKNLDLTELTPSMEQQLYQAKRLNNADPDSMMEMPRLAAAAAASNAFRYDLADSGHYSQPSDNRAQNRFSGQWLDGLHMLKAARRSGGGDGDRETSFQRMLGGNDDDDYQRRFSRGLSGQLGRSESGLGNRMIRDQDKDYGALVGAVPLSSPAFIDNQEGASRKSLWTSELLRDLLIAQEAASRARYIAKLARAYERNQGAGQNSLGPAVAQSAAEAASNREKRRRCKVDPNLGVKNPSFCDTDAYFGAADYSMRDVWDSAGR